MSQYREAGVDIDAASSSVERIKKLIGSTHGPGVLSTIGGFSGLYHAGALEFKDLVLASGADGVGTKVKISQAMGKHDTVGIDLVAMNCDDVVTSGARPLFFLDYIAVSKLEPEVITDLVKGIVEGCNQAGCVLLGGETAQMPDVYRPGEYDLAGFCVGGVERSEIIDGSRISAGDVLIGFRSSGLHSNGYTLARRILLDEAKLRLDQVIPEFGRTLGEELLEPTRIYAKSLISLKDQVDVKGIAHITGGGILGNVPRILPRGLAMSLTYEWGIPPVFRLIQDLGNVSSQEMYRVFNMGVGMVVVVSPIEADRAIAVLAELGIDAFAIGEITKHA
ncbi:MAG: phosphoribosylformylglycinamidine cyclo-ligase [Bacillota bacterium]|jgi:phosphoribosylformylglycinamidine cyclo-ligase